MPSTNQERIYEYLKKYKGVKFPIDHLAKIFECNPKSMRYSTSRMYRDKKGYPGFEMEKEIISSSRGNDYIRHVFFVK